MSRAAPAFAVGTVVHGMLSQAVVQARARCVSRTKGRPVSRRVWSACTSINGTISDRDGNTITREVVEHTVKLAHLEMSDSEIDRLTPEFQKIVGFIDTLSTLDVDGVEPMSRVEDLTNVLREDVPAAFPDVDGIMSEAPLVERDFIRVPKIGTEQVD